MAGKVGKDTFAQRDRDFLLKNGSRETRHNLMLSAHVADDWVLTIGGQTI